MVTATGWTHREIEEMSLCDLLDLLDYWQDTPPAHVVLAARYMVRSGRTGRRESAPEPHQTEDEAMGEFNALGGMLGVGAKPMPAHLREMAEWAEQMTKGKVH